MSPTFSVRPARAEDAAQIGRLSSHLSSGLAPEAVAHRVRRMLTEPTHACFVAANADALSGLLVAERRILLQSAERVELTALVVDPAFRRRGVGAALVAAAEAWARGLGIADLVVRSSLSRDASHAFYRSLGYALHKTQHVYTRSLTP